MADTDENPPVTTDERYTAAVGQSNMRMELDRRSPADIITAAALHPYDIGRMLQRLRAEWDCQSFKKPADAATIERISCEYTREPSWSPHAGLVRQDIREAKSGKVIGVEYVNPLVLAAKHAAEWRAHEQGLVFQRLKTLPELRRVLCEWLGSESAAHTVAAVLRWWLSPNCPKCEGRKFKVATGTNRTTKHACNECTRPGRIQGQAKIPHSGEGRRLLGFIGQCVADASRATRAINR